MKNLTLLMIAVWSFIGLVIIAAIIFGAVFFDNYKGGNFSMMDLSVSDRSNTQAVAEETIPMSGIDKIELEFFSDECNVYFTSGSNIEMKHFVRNVSQERYARARVSGGTLNISTKPTGIGGFSLFNIGSRSQVDIYLPEAYKEALYVNLMSGTLRFDDRLALEKLAVKISSGTIRSDHIIEAGDLEITVTSGSVRLQGGVKADDYKLKTSSGNIDIGEQLVGSGSVNVTSGTIKLEGVDIANDLSVKISSGTVNIGIAGNPSLKFSGRRSSGTIRAYFGLYNDGSTFSSTIGEAPYKNLDVQVTSGTVRITQD